MESRLYKSLQKTSFWMLIVALITGLFNGGCWLIALHHYTAFGLDHSIRNKIEYLFIISLIIASISSYNALKAAYLIHKYTKEQNPIDIQKAFIQESKYWTNIMFMVIIGALFLLLIYFRLI